jgi:hypothetical protein
MINAKSVCSLILAATLSACGSDKTPVSPPPPPQGFLTLVSGNEQSATAGDRLADPLVVRLATADGKPVSGKYVLWTVTTTPGGELSQTRTATDENGEASVSWQMGTTEGREGAQALYAGTGSVVSFTATAMPHPQPPPGTPLPPRPIILHSDGTSWTPSLILPALDYGATVWGLSSTQVYAGFVDCPDIVTYDGTAWRGSLTCAFRQVWGIWGPAPDHLYAIEKGLGRPISQPQYIYHFDGNTWNIVYNNNGFDLLAISGVGTTEVIAVGKNGRIVRLLGSDWTVQTSGTTQELRAVWGDPNGSGAFAVGTGGTILHYDGSTWTAQISPTTQSLNGVWGSSARDVFAVGDNGTILHYDGTLWTQQASGTTQRFNAVWAAPNSAVAVGDNGTIVRYNGTSWTAEYSGVTTNLVSVWGSSSSDIFVVSQ